MENIVNECKLVNRPSWSKPNEWANPSVIDYESMVDSDINFIESKYDILKHELNLTISDYVSDFDDFDNTTSKDPYERYPNKFEMTGEYYINNATCEKSVSGYSYSFIVTFLAKHKARTAQGAENLDYHGLEVLLNIDQNGQVESDGVVSSWGI